MVILIGGNSMAGKTLLAQKLLEKYKIPYLSIDHLKMGIFRGWDNCGFTPETNEEVITCKLWPIIKGIIMTNIENDQSIIIEGCYLPYNLDDLDIEYTSKIIFCKICFSENYINNNYLEKIIGNKSIIEKREYFTFTKEELIKDNIKTKELCIKNNTKYFEIKEKYKKEIKYVYKWIKGEIRKTGCTLIMTFPEEEHESIKGFLRDMGYCYTTRVFKEIRKYKTGNKYKTNFGSVVEILEVKRYKKIIEHPYNEDLTNDQRKQIAKYSEDIGKEYEVIKFKDAI